MGEITTPVQELPDGWLVFYQFVNRGRNQARNFRYALCLDGRWYYAPHSADANHSVPFDTPLPTAPTKQFPPSVPAAVEQLLADSDFFRQEPVQVRSGVRGGSWSIVTARRGGQIHEVSYENLSNPLVDFLRELWQYEPEQADSELPPKGWLDA